MKQRQLLFMLLAAMMPLLAGARTVWTGETVIKSDWSNYELIDKSLFADAQADHYLRVKFTDLKNNAQLALKSTKSGWPLLTGTEIKSINGLYQQYTITSDMLAELKEYGLVVSGCNYTLTEVEIIDPATLKTLTLSVPVENNWVYATGTPTLKIKVQNPNAETVTADCMLRVYTDANVSYTTVKKSLSVAANSSETAELSFDAAPGFYRIYATVNDEMARPAFVIGVNTTSIVSAPDKQSDFDTFWQTAKTQLDGIAIDATLTEITSKSTSARKVYLVEMQSIPDGLTGDPVTVRGYYCEPTDGQKHPVIMHYLGYDSGYRPGGESATPYCPSGDANPDYAEFYLSTRGQSINNRPASDRDDGIEKDFTNSYGDWFAFNFGDKDKYYYRGAYMDCVRAIDFMATRETSDMDQLFAEGQSQGGALTYAAAALSGHTFKAIAPAIPFMGDFPDYFQVGSWPASVATANQGTMTDEDMYAFLSYFDTKNLVTAISCPVITSIGLQDNVCPPHTNIAPYNNVKTPVADKQIVFNAELGHQVNSLWYSTYMNFFQKYEASSTEETEAIWTGSVETGDWTGYVDLSYANRGLLTDTRMTDVIRITFITTDEGAQLQLSNPAASWAKFSDEAFTTPSYTTGEQTFGYTIDKASVLEDIQLTGIIVTGKNLTITKVELVKTEGRYDAASVTIGADGIATYSSSKKLDFAGTGVTPYYASEVTTGSVTLTSTTTTWDYQGYVLRGAAGTYDVPVTETADYPSVNYLKATGDYPATVTASTTGTYHYIFAKSGSGVGFYTLTADHTLAAHKAYLETTTDIKPATGSAPVALIFDDGATSIKSIGQLDNLKSDNSIYDLSGRKIVNGTSSSRKSIGIVNGRKVILK